LSTEPEDRTHAPFGWGELNVAMARASRRPTPHPRHDEVRALLLDVPAAHGQRQDERYRMGDHHTLFADGRAIWVKPERSYIVNDWWTDAAGRVWAIDDGALDGLLHGLDPSMRGVDGFIADLTAIRQGPAAVEAPVAADEDDEEISLY
jgi:hypothetical protein